MIHCLIVLANKLTLIVKGPFTTLSQGCRNLIWMSKHLNCVKISKLNSYRIYSNRRKILSDKKTLSFFDTILIQFFIRTLVHQTIWKCRWVVIFKTGSKVCPCLHGTGLEEQYYSHCLEDSDFFNQHGLSST